MSRLVIERVHQDYLRFKDATVLLDVHPVTLWRWVKAGKLQTYRIGLEVLIEKAEVERLRQERQ